MTKRIELDPITFEVIKHRLWQINDEQAIANEVLLEATEIGMPYIINHPIGIGDVRSRSPARPPEVGEHCDEVLAQLGYSQTEIEQLRSRGVI